MAPPPSGPAMKNVSSSPTCTPGCCTARVVGTTVVDHELVTRTFPDGPGTLEVVVTYEVRGGLIRRVWLASGPRMGTT